MAWAVWGGGDEAAKIAVQTIRQFAYPCPVDESSLMAAAKQAHVNIVSAQQMAPELKRMATTLTAGMFFQHELVGVHCGDSRASVARSQGIRWLTTDHTEGERLFRGGKLTKEQLRDYPRKNILDSALGARSTED